MDGPERGKWHAGRVSMPVQMADDPLVAFAAARLDEAAARAGSLLRTAQSAARELSEHALYYLGRPVPGWHSWPDAEAMCSLVLRDVEAKRAIIGSQTSDHAPVETMYGLCCRTCVDWQDAPLADGGETEFGIAIPHQWPCKVARSAVACWSGHPDYRKDEWAL